ncbi:MAG: hypothetical protein CL608_17610 [Anaerolineaceae bacterium]|nr:hypothetical protein [Anaerolineaceae bacterium]
MKNGNAFRTFVDETIQYLSGLKVVVYYAEPIPSATDEKMRLIVERFMRGTAVDREQFQQTLTQEHRSHFGIYGHRAATLAVRQDSRDWLLSGLVGAVISNYIIPPKRNVDVSLAVYHHCAHKINASPDELFSESARYAQPELAGKLTSFGRRADINLKQFGWQEQKTPEGVRYKFSW